MRAAFAQTLSELAAADPRIMLLTGDLGFMALEVFAERHPQRFLNVGVAEQNMLGLAVGLAEAGFVPFVYSIVTFAALRPYEFLRNGAVLQRLPLRVVGMGGGFEYGSAGPTHHGLEDIAVMRALPGLTVIAPADGRQTRSALQATAQLPGPIYFRLGKDDRSEVSGLDGRFAPDSIPLVRAGDDVLILVMGGIAPEAVAAAEQLAQLGVSAAVGIVAQLAPVPTAALLELLQRYRLVLTVEAHVAAGGLAALVAEQIAGQGLACRLVRCAVETAPDGFSGSQSYYLRRHGLDRDSLVRCTLQALGRTEGL
jgi:transketolase